MEPGKRYIKIVRRTGFGEEINPSGSAYAFLDSTTGDILMAASWKAPAKHARGNLFDGNPLKCVGPHGIAYLR